MDANNMLSSLFSDPEKLQSAISMASSLLGGQTDSAPAEPPSAPAAQESFSPAYEPPSQPAFSAPPFPSHSPTYDPSAELMSKAMPVLSAIARSGQNAISREKINLLNALKPFVAESVGGQLDHAMRLVSMARMARSAMGQLSSGSHGGAASSNDDGTREL